MYRFKTYIVTVGTDCRVLVLIKQMCNLGVCMCLWRFKDLSNENVMGYTLLIYDDFICSCLIEKVYIPGYRFTKGLTQN